MIALQLSLDNPDKVHSLLLLEPSFLLFVPSGAKLMEELMPTVQRYQAGDKAGAADSFMKIFVGSDYRSIIDRALPPGSFDEYITNFDTLMRVEFPAMQSWKFTQEDAKRIGQPVLDTGNLPRAIPADHRFTRLSQDLEE